MSKKNLGSSIDDFLKKENIFAEAQAQAQCMRGSDFRRAYEAFVAKRAPAFEGD